MVTRDKHETPVNFREFRKNLAGYLRRARQGSHFVVTSRGEEVARIMPPVAKADQKRQLIGMFRGQFEIAPDFDEMPADLIAAMEGDNE
jgi:prevent-host-death family protein